MAKPKKSVQRQTKFSFNSLSPRKIAQKEQDFDKCIIFISMYIYIYISKKRRAGVLTDQNRLRAGMGTDVVPMEQMWYRRLINI